MVVHAFGIWLMLLIGHGMLVEFIGPVGVHLPLYAGILVAALALVSSKWSMPSTTILFALLGFVISLTVAALVGIDLDASLVALSLYLKGVALALMIAMCVTSRPELERLVYYFLSALAIGAGYTVYQHVTGRYVFDTEYMQRAAGLRSDPNDTAMLLVAGIPLCAFWMESSRGKIKKTVGAALAILLSIGVVLTESRGGFLALALGGLALYLRRPTINTTIMGLVVVGIVLALAPGRYWDRIGTLLTGKELNRGSSLQNRLELQLVGIRILMEEPIFGVGPGNFGRAYASEATVDSGLPTSWVAPATGERARVFGVAHNMHLEMFVEGGLVGGLLFWAVLLLALRGMLSDPYKPPAEAITSIRGKRALDIGISLAIALGVMLFAGLFLSQGKNSVLWFMIGMGLSMKKIGERRLEANRGSRPYIRHSIVEN